MIKPDQPAQARSCPQVQVVQLGPNKRVLGLRAVSLRFSRSDGIFARRMSRIVKQHQQQAGNKDARRSRQSGRPGFPGPGHHTNFFHVATGNGDPRPGLAPASGRGPPQELFRPFVLCCSGFSHLGGDPRSASRGRAGNRGPEGKRYAGSCETALPARDSERSSPVALRPGSRRQQIGVAHDRDPWASHGPGEVLVPDPARHRDIQSALVRPQPPARGSPSCGSRRAAPQVGPRRQPVDDPLSHFPQRPEEREL